LETIKIAFIGHVDHGKSTLIGRVLLDTGSVPKEKMAEIAKISRELGKEAELAYLADQLKEEREHDMTIDTTQIFFRTRKRNFVIIDNPGHVELLKNMMTGAAQADAALLLLDVNEGVMEQTTRHAYIARMLGIQQVIVVLNKMDLVEFAEGRFDSVAGDLAVFLGKIGLKPLCIIPVSAREGDNISKRSRSMKWYKGPVLLELLESLRATTVPEDRLARLSVQDVYERGGERILVGRVESGSFRRGGEVLVLPPERKAVIRSIKVFGEHDRKLAGAGECVGLVLDNDAGLGRGAVLCGPGAEPPLAKSFEANLLWLAEKPLDMRSEYLLRCATQEGRCSVGSIKARIDSSTMAVIEEDARSLGANETARVTVNCEKPFLVEASGAADEFGRFVMESAGCVCGVGLVTEIGR